MYEGINPTHIQFSNSRALKFSETAEFEKETSQSQNVSAPSEKQPDRLLSFNLEQ